MNEGITVHGYHPVPLRTPNTAWSEESILIPEPWTRKGKCLEMDPELFFPEPGGGHSYLVEMAKKACRGCPVRALCAQYAIDHNERFGIWGGLTGRERANIRKARA